MHGADVRDRTGDLVLTKDVLYQLSYVSDSFRLLERVMESNPHHQLGRLRFYH